MIRKTALVLITLLLLTGLVSGIALAQTYSFSLDREVVNAYYNAEGTLSLDYIFDFSNDAGASAIDFVDVGLPFRSYDLGSVKADVDGKAITDISKADPQNLQGGGAGVTLALHGNAIAPGTSGRVHLYIGTINRVAFPYTENNVKDYASINFSPNWFGSSFVHGKTDMTVSIHLPPGIKPEEPIYYQPQGGWPGSDTPVTDLDSQGRVLYTWNSPEANGHTQYTFGAAFPARVIPASAIVQKPAFSIPIEGLVCGGIVLVILVFFVWGIYAAIWGAKKRKLAYLPPKISIEGHGIKRGLTAVEAAILEEQPMDKVMTMILFSVLKKAAATVITKDPLEIQVTEPLPAELNPYEQEFLAAFKVTKGAERRQALQTMMIGLVKSISEKMKGFSRKETIAYYQDITKRAWEQVEAAGTPDVKSQKYDEVMDWTMLDKNYGDRTRTVFGQGPVFVPIWWGRYDPVFRGGGGAQPSTISTGGNQGGGGGFSMPSLPGSNFAASVVNGAQTFAAGAIGDVAAFTSGITNKTNPPPPPSTTSGSGKWGGGGGGSHCACACACAGCACACAGGGR
ncbi:MAG: hypothetical protein PHQ40_21265 [Anaerolineaceae bacterium]|nr:hypothetical protein [Anaerolineaceae bacterium]